MIGYPQRTTTYVDFLNPDYTTGAVKYQIFTCFLNLAKILGIFVAFFILIVRNI